MTGSAVPVLDVWRQKKISIKGEGSGERGAIIGPESRGLADSQVLTWNFHVNSLTGNFHVKEAFLGKFQAFGSCFHSLQCLTGNFLVKLLTGNFLVKEALLVQQTILNREFPC